MVKNMDMVDYRNDNIPNPTSVFRSYREVVEILREKKLSCKLISNDMVQFLDKGSLGGSHAIKEKT